DPASVAPMPAAVPRAPPPAHSSAAAPQSPAISDHDLPVPSALVPSQPMSLMKLLLAMPSESPAAPAAMTGAATVEAAPPAAPNVAAPQLPTLSAFDAAFSPFS